MYMFRSLLNNKHIILLGRGFSDRKLPTVIWKESFLNSTEKIGTKSELKEREGMYYIGDIVDIDGDGWVDEETAELILVEYNAGVE